MTFFQSSLFKQIHFSLEISHLVSTLIMIFLTTNFKDTQITFNDTYNLGNITR